MFWCRPMQEAQEINDISHIWTRFSRRWALVGVLSGVLSGLAILVVGAIFSSAIPREPTFPLKLIGFALLGPKALQIGGFLGVLAGFLLHFGLCAWFGLVFAQAVQETARRRVLLLLGALAGVAVWLFWFAMFMPSFNQALFAFLPKMISLGLHLVFGLTFATALILLRPRLLK